MTQVPTRVDKDSLLWFYEQHRLLWTWVAELNQGEIVSIVSKYTEYTPDYAIKRAWPGWGERWGLLHGSFACEVGGNERTRCTKCPLGADYCQQAGSGYQKFLASIRTGDLPAFKTAALEIRDAWKKPENTKVFSWW